MTSPEDDREAKAQAYYETHGQSDTLWADLPEAFRLAWRKRSEENVEASAGPMKYWIVRTSDGTYWVQGGEDSITGLPWTGEAEQAERFRFMRAAELGDDKVLQPLANLIIRADDVIAVAQLLATQRDDARRLFNGDWWDEPKENDD